MVMPIPALDSLARDLGPLERVEPPPGLRKRILRRHRLRRAQPVVYSLGLAVVLTFVLFSMQPPAEDPVAHWQARSKALEADWRQIGDRSWLLQDARARALLSDLELVDRDLARAIDQQSKDRERLSLLWQTRADLLSSLIDSNRQGGIARRI